MDAVQLLLKAKADVRVWTKKGATCLCKAAEHGHKEVVEQLLDCGAPSGPSEGFSPSGKSHMMTPLCQAIGGATPESGVIQMLLERGESSQFLGEIGRRALLLSVKKNYSFAVEEMVGRQEMDPNTRTDHGWTLLQISAHLGHAETAAVLLEYKVRQRHSNASMH
jgi:ankyrin repeat protein